LAQTPARTGHENDDLRAARDALIDLDRRLSREIAHRKRLESRLESATLAQSQAERARQDAARECEDMRRELALVDIEINGRLGQDASAAPDLGGAQVLYVGGRANQVPQLKALVERAGGAFLHHDGGIEHSMTLLPGLIGRADFTVFPIDCISHDAMGMAKRQCRQSAKPFTPLRTSSLACLLGALAAFAGRRNRRIGWVEPFAKPITRGGLPNIADEFRFALPILRGSTGAPQIGSRV